MSLHNHLSFVREKKKAQELFIFDVGATNQFDLDEGVESVNKLIGGLDLDASFKTRKNSEITVNDGLLSEHDADNRIGLFRCKPLNLHAVTTTKQGILTLKK